MQTMIDSASFIVSHPTGNNFVKALLGSLEKKNHLKRFFTTIGFGKDYESLFLNKIKNRRLYDIPDSRITRHWHPEIRRLFAKGNQEKRRRLVDQCYASLDLFLSNLLLSSSAEIIHAYEDGALNSFEKAKNLGIQCSYELPIAHWSTVRRLLCEESERYPEWEPTLESTREPEEKLLRKQRELELADRITCPSEFVFQSIPEEIRNKVPCQISPFGCAPCGSPFDRKASRPKLPLKLLFVGSMSQRKGLSDLFEAMKMLKEFPVKLSILGQPSMSMEFYRKQFSEFEYFPPCSNLKVKKIMSNHDVLVLPSIIEGFALVQLEALSCGMPIIVTPNTGGESLVEEGVTGHLVPIRNPSRIAEAIVRFIDEDIANGESFRLCQLKAQQYSWNSYAQKIINFNLSANTQVAN